MNKVILAPAAGGAKLTFDAQASLVLSAFVLPPDSYGGHRLVVDLKPNKAKQAAKPKEEKQAKQDHSATDSSGEKAEEQLGANVHSSGPGYEQPKHTAANEEHSPTKEAHASNADGSTKTSKASDHKNDHHTDRADTALSTKLEAAMKAASTEKPHAAAETTSVSDVKVPPVEKQTTAHQPKPSSASAEKVAQKRPKPKGTTATITKRHDPVALTRAAVDAERALDAGRTAEACRMAESAQMRDPYDLRVTTVLGWCRLKEGFAETAKREFDKVVSADPEFNRARIGLAEAERQLGNVNTARQHLEAVLENGPPSEEVSKIVAMIEALQKPKSAPTSTTKRSPIYGVTTKPAKSTTGAARAPAVGASN